MEFGIAQYFGSYGKEKCSYCKSSKETSKSVGMNIYNISGQSYQHLIDRGWRRSGLYCYKMHKTDCCAFYTIRCDATKFELTKSKRKVLNKMIKFLQSESIEKTMTDMNKKVDKHFESMECDKELQINNTIAAKVDFNLNNITNDLIEPMSINNDNNIDSTIHQLTHKTCFKKSIDFSKLKQTDKRKSKRILKRIDKLKNKYNCTEEDAINMMIANRKSNKIIKPKQSLENLINQANNFKNQLKIKIVPATRKTSKISHELYKKYQKIIHKSEEDELDIDKFERFLISNPFQKNDVNSELKTYNDLPDKYGCYHMQYWLNDKLIAVNVIDILPECVSSVYFFYDTDYSFLNLGTYSSLREIELVRKLNKFNPNIKYYYMGFYIHSCVKMRYKGNINSSYLLCPETYIFHNYKWCKENFDLNKSCRLTIDERIIDSNSAINLYDVRVLYRQVAMTYQIYHFKVKSKLSEKQLEEQKQEIEEYAKLVGNKFIYNNLLYISE